MAYNSDREGYETKDGGLIRIHGDDKVRIDIYNGDERVKYGHERDTINFDTNTGKGSIDSHNADKSESSSTDVSCFLTTACMKHMKENFDDNCYELDILRWFRDNFVSKEDKKEYYEKAPMIVAKINEEDDCNEIYNNIYDNVISVCVRAIEYGKYDFAYETYKKCVLDLEENYIDNKQKTLSLV